MNALSKPYLRLFRNILVLVFLVICQSQVLAQNINAEPITIEGNKEVKDDQPSSNDGSEKSASTDEKESIKNQENAEKEADVDQKKVNTSSSDHQGIQKTIPAKTTVPNLGLITAATVGAVVAGSSSGGSTQETRTVVSTSYSYAGNIETARITFSDGTVQVLTANAISNTVSWASDNVTRTTTYTFAGGRTNAVVDTVPGTVAYTYSGATETATTTFGNGVTSSSTANAISNTVSWASDNVTRTTTYTFAGGRTNAVVDTVLGVETSPVITAAVYPSGWTAGAAVTPPSVSARFTTFGNGTIVTSEDGTSTKPFIQSTLVSSSIRDSNSFVQSPSTTYDLRWGMPDGDGPAVAALFPNATNALASPLFYAGIRVSSYTSLFSGPTLVKPSDDILDAWNNGWTGKNINVLLIDNFDGRSSCNSPSSCHGIITMMNVHLTAPGTSKFGMDFNSLNPIKGSDGLNLASATNMNVVNLSFTAVNSWICNNGCGIAPDDTTWANGIAAAASANARFVNLLSGTSSVTYVNDLADAVVTKSAGNNNIDAKYDTLTRALMGDASISVRLLVVGALDKDGAVTSGATKAAYSDFAGSDSAIRERFVMANGSMPWNNNAVGVNGWQFNTVSGTSFAAPRVAGYAAIVMQKFPNLDAVKTSSIILDTARYDTLTCHPNCDPAIYGRGEASLSRALAPIGSLR